MPVLFRLLAGPSSSWHLVAPCLLESFWASRRWPVEPWLRVPFCLLAGLSSSPLCPWGSSPSIAVLWRVRHLSPSRDSSRPESIRWAFLVCSPVFRLLRWEVLADLTYQNWYVVSGERAWTPLGCLLRLFRSGRGGVSSPAPFTSGRHGREELTLQQTSGHVLLRMRDSYWCLVYLQFNAPRNAVVGCCTVCRSLLH